MDANIELSAHGKYSMSTKWKSVPKSMIKILWVKLLKTVVFLFVRFYFFCEGWECVAASSKVYEIRTHPKFQPKNKQVENTKDLTIQLLYTRPG